MNPETAVAAALLMPAAGAVGVGLTGKWPNLREAVTLITGVITLAFVITIVPEVLAGGRPGIEVLTVIPGLTLAFEVEPLGMLFALVAAGLWILTSTYAIGYMRGHHEENQTRFYICFAVAISAALGIAFARNLFTLFLFYEALTLSTFPLVTHHGTEKAMRAGRVYLGNLLFTSVVFLLLAIIWTWYVTGTLEFRPGGILAGKVSDPMLGALLALFAFGTGKAALMPFHKWLPAAMVAPTPVSALLHAVAVVKGGVFTVLKIVVYVFGIENLHNSGVSLWLMYAASATILIASIIALTRDNLKERLAYSTISQLSYIVLGAALATDASVLGGGMHIAMHAMGKITLFFCAGAIMVATHKTEVTQLDGIGRTMPFTMFAFLLGSLSIIGLPPFGGVWSKWFLALGAADAHQYVFIGVLMLSSLLSIGYLMPVVIRAFFRDPAPADGHADGHEDDGEHHDEEPRKGGFLSGIKEAPVFCVVPLCLTALGCIVLFFYAGRIYDLLLAIPLEP